MFDFLTELTRWYNLIFILPVFIILVYQLLHTLAGLNHAGLDSSFGDLSAILADQLSDAKSTSPLSRFFAFLNAGQIPPLMVVVTFLLFWGVIGFLCNHWFIPLFGNFVLPAVFISFVVSFALSSIITHLVSQGIDLIFPTPHTEEGSSADLIGTVARVTSREVNTTFGIARTEGGPFHTTIYCQVDAEEEIVKLGERVVLWDYDPQTHFYKVQRLNEDDLRGRENRG